MSRHADRAAFDSNMRRRMGEPAVGGSSHVDTRKEEARRREAEEQSWQDRSGPVEIRVRVND